MLALIAGVALMTAVGSSVARHGGMPSVRERPDPVESTMHTMRLAGTLLDELRREAGSYPLADGKLRPVSDALTADRPVVARPRLEDAWGRPLQYRASGCCYRLVSLGADGVPEQDYRSAGLYPSGQIEITEAVAPSSDLVLMNGRFVRRPFGAARPAFETINAINKIATAMMSYAIDNNRYAGASSTFVPVSELAVVLAPFYLPELPAKDGWGHPILYFSTGAAFGLASFGADGKPDRSYLTDLSCGTPWNDEGASPEDGADVVFANGHLVNWPPGVEP